MEIVELEEYAFSTPCTVILGGPSGSGKTSIILAIIKHRATVFDKPVQGVVYCYTEMQEVFKEFEGTDITLHHGMPSMEDLEGYVRKYNNKLFLIIFDDLQSELVNDATAEAISCKLAHHRNFVSIAVRQNIFASGKTSRTQSVNSTYMILTRSLRDVRQIGILGSQLYPGRSKEFVRIYEDAMDNPINPELPPHLVINCHPLKGNRKYQLMTNVFTPDAVRIVYRV